MQDINAQGCKNEDQTLSLQDPDFSISRRPWLCEAWIICEKCHGSHQCWSDIPMDPHSPYMTPFFFFGFCKIKSIKVLSSWHWYIKISNSVDSGIHYRSNAREHVKKAQGKIGEVALHWRGERGSLLMMSPQFIIIIKHYFYHINVL